MYQGMDLSLRGEQKDKTDKKGKTKQQRKENTKNWGFTRAWRGEVNIKGDKRTMSQRFAQTVSKYALYWL